MSSKSHCAALYKQNIMKLDRLKLFISQCNNHLHKHYGEITSYYKDFDTEWPSGYLLIIVRLYQLLRSI